MKKFALILILAVNLVSFRAEAQRGNNPLPDKADRPKVGLVLCGGGAKGAAHIGVLKVLEEANVPVDIIVGTSMGAIVGGMYSMGYDAHHLDSIISNCDWAFLLSDNTLRKDASFTMKMMDEKFLISIPFYNIRTDKKKNDNSVPLLPGGFISGQNVLNLMNGLAIGYQDSISFNDLPIPFACVATNLSTGEEVVLNEGYLPISMRASMAIPGVFSPVTIKGKVLVDGGMVNNFPVDVAKELGADIIIGVDVQNELAKPDELKSINQVFMQIMGLMGNDRYLENVKRTDIYIKPDVSDFTTFSFSKNSIDSLIVNGYIAAKRKYSELETLSKKLNTGENLRHRLKAPKATEITKDTFMIADIIMHGVSEQDGKWLLRKAGLNKNSRISGDEINRAISIFMGTRAFSSVTYMLQKIAGSPEENLFIDFKKGPVNVFGIGIRFDTEEAAAILMHLGIHQNDLRGSKLGMTARLSYNPVARLGYTYVFENFPKFDASYTFRSTDMDIYQSTNSMNYLKFYEHDVEVAFSNRYLRNFNFQLGGRFQSFNFNSFLSEDSNLTGLDVNSRSYLGYFLNAVMDDRNSRYFPTAGMSFDAGANYYQTDFTNNFHDFAALHLNLTGASSIGRVSFLPAFYARVIIGNTSETPFANFIGGEEPGRYVSQQIPFIGINHANYVDNSVAVLRFDLRSRIGRKHYVYALSNYARTGEDFGNLFNVKGKGFWGFGVKYAYNTLFGPLSFTLHWSDYNKTVGAYLSLGYYF